MDRKDCWELFEQGQWCETEKLLYLQVLNSNNALSYEKNDGVMKQEQLNSKQSQHNDPISIVPDPINTFPDPIKQQNMPEAIEKAKRLEECKLRSSID